MGSWFHLIGRFFRVVFAVRLTDSERTWATGHVGGQQEAFFAQSKADQRHGFEAARRVGDRPDLIRAALLHDIGKRHAGLSPVLRALVAAAAKVGLPVNRRGAMYLDHGRLGADELRALGAEQIVIDFAASHHAGRPGSISPHDWVVLIRADR